MHFPGLKKFERLKQVKSISDVFEFEEMVGKGSFGNVKKARPRGSNIPMAVKIVDKVSLSANSALLDQIFSDLKLLQ